MKWTTVRSADLNRIRSNGVEYHATIQRPNGLVDNYIVRKCGKSWKVCNLRTGQQRMADTAAQAKFLAERM